MAEFNDRRAEIRDIREGVQRRAKKRGVKMGWSTAHMVAAGIARREQQGTVVHVDFGPRLGGKTCSTCKGYGRIRGETRPDESGVGMVTPTRRCEDCAGLGEKL